MHPPPHASRTSFMERWYPGFRLSPCTAVRLAGFLPVLLVLGLIALAYITCVLATLAPLRTLHPSVVYPLLIFFHFIYLNVLANYLLLVFADPGSPPPDWKAAPPPSPFSPHLPTHRFLSTPALSAHPTQALRVSTPPMTSDSDDGYQDAGMLLPPQSHSAHPPKPLTSSFRYAHLMRERSYDGTLRYCRVCAAYKPDRSHHCSVCRRCILRMDHHCVFVNNCVSFYNHKFFISFILYAFFGCLFVAIVSFPTFAAVLSTSPSHMKPHSSGGWLIAKARMLWGHTPIRVVQRMDLIQFANLQGMSSTLKTLAMVGYITSIAFAFALAIFVILHLYLVAKGRTTIEMYELTDQMRVARVLEYDLGFAKNLRKVFGSVPFWWFFPTRVYVEGDGLDYERRTLPDLRPVTV